MREIIITPQSAGGRLDKLLAKYLDKAGQGFIYKMLRKKNITLNDKKAEGSAILEAGDCIRLYFSEETLVKFHTETEGTPKKAAAGPEKAGKAFEGTEIIFEDDNILAVCKPSGLLSQKSRPDDVSVNDFILQHVPGNDIFNPGIANRLDRNTSGLVLAGKNPASARELNRAIRTRDLGKKYLALVKGEVRDGGRLEGRLYKDSGKNIVKIEPLKDSGNEAGDNIIITEYRPVKSAGNMTLLEVDLITGKSHQIRAHLASAGHPIAGDPKYGDREINKELKEKYGLKDQLLHAYKIEFTGMQGILEYLNGTEITAPLPELFEKILELSS